MSVFQDRVVGSQGCLKGPRRLGTGDREGVEYVRGRLQQVEPWVPPSTLAISSAFLLYGRIPLRLWFGKRFPLPKEGFENHSSGMICHCDKIATVILFSYYNVELGSKI